MKEDLKSSLLNLQGLEFIYEKSLFPELEYIFRHVLTQEVAYNSLLLKRRKEIHEKIGKAIEEIYPDRLEEFYEMLAFHYSRSENAAQSCHYLKLAGDKAVGNFAMWEAYRSYSEAIETARGRPGTRDDKSTLLDILLAVAFPLLILGCPQGSLELFEEGERLAQELGDRKAWAWFHSRIGVYYCAVGGDPVKGREYIETALGDAELTQEVAIIVPTMLDLVASYALEGQFMRISELAPKVIDLMEQSHTEKEGFGRTSQPYSVLSAYYGLALGATGNFEEGARALEKAQSFARGMKNLHSLAMVEMLYGIFHQLMGDWQNSVKQLRASAEHMETGQVAVFLGLVKGWYGIGALMMGEPETAIDHLQEGLGILADHGLPFFRGSLHALLSEAHLALGDPQTARSHAEQGLSLCQENNERYHEAESCIALGRAIGTVGPEHFEEGRDYILQGISILEELHVRPRQAVGLLYLAELQADAGRKDEARENLKKAEGMFQGMGMDYWLGKTQEALATM
jgi:tetratricopeptide (TPR) repeat protein